METIERMGFLPLLDSCVDGFSADAMITPNAATACSTTAAGSGHCGNGKGLPSTRGISSMASFSTARPDSSDSSGGPTSATGAAAAIRNPTKRPLKALFLQYFRPTGV